METIVKTLEQKGWFPLVNEVNYQMSKAFDKYIIKQTGDLNILFRTGGGSMTNALEIIDSMNFYTNATGKKINAFVLSKCASAAITILSACNGQREASIGSRFLFHSSAKETKFFFLDGEAKNRKIFESHLKDLENVTKLCTKSRMVGFGLTEKKIRELENQGEISKIPLSAEEALRLGIIHKITPLPSNF